MRIILSGASGLLGAKLLPELEDAGHEPWRLVRTQEDTPRTMYWNPAEGHLDRDSLRQTEAFVHLSGENVAGRRWSPEFKQRLRSSRINTTRLLVNAITQLDTKPSVFLCASAIGYYGDRGDTQLDEESGPGDGFLAKLCEDWEAATRPLTDDGIRVVNLRLGPVLSADGGAMEKLLPVFRKGAGGVVGPGTQYFSWVSDADAVGAILHCLGTAEITGPVNIVSPNPVTNRTFTEQLGKALGRPTLLPVPAFAARLAMGEMADEMLLASARVQPRRLLDSGYGFIHESLESALADILAA